MKAFQSNPSNSIELRFEKQHLRELFHHLIREGAVLIVDEGGVHPAALVCRLVRHNSVLIHVRLQEGQPT